VQQWIISSVLPDAGEQIPACDEDAGIAGRLSPLFCFQSEDLIRNDDLKSRSCLVYSGLPDGYPG